MSSKVIATMKIAAQVWAIVAGVVPALKQAIATYEGRSARRIRVVRMPTVIQGANLAWIARVANADLPGFVRAMRTVTMSQSASC